MLYKYLRGCPRHGALTALCAVALAFFLSGCGGNGDDDTAPSIERFSADRASYFVGESARLEVRYAGGSGRIEPDIGAVTPDGFVTTPPLTRPTTYRLTVERAGRSVTRELTVAADYRFSYRNIGDLAVDLHRTVALEDGSALVIGGSRPELNVLSHWIERVDVARGRVTRAGELFVGRADPTVTGLDDGRWLVTGGAISENIARSASELLQMHSGGTLSVKRTGALQRLRLYHAAVQLADGRVLVTGGHVSGEGSFLGISSSAELWDPASGAFRLLSATMAHGRAAHTMTRLPDGRVLIVGGYSTPGAYRFAEIFDPGSERFTPVADNRPGRRAAHAAFSQPNGDVLVFGGEDESTGIALNSVLRFVNASGAWQTEAPLIAPRFGAAAVLTHDASTLQFGGLALVADELRVLRSAERYAASGGATMLPPLSVGRAWHTATLLRGPLAGKVLLVGGRGEDGQFAQAVQLFE